MQLRYEYTKIRSWKNWVIAVGILTFCMELFHFGQMCQSPSCARLASLVIYLQEKNIYLDTKSHYKLITRMFIHRLINKIKSNYTIYNSQ